MQKIEIENFHAIKKADIEIKKVLILIGEQATGKSTIAKLIYFFKTLRDDFFNQISQNNDRNFFDIAKDLIIPTREKFYDFFGSTFHLSDFKIKYYYDVKSNIYVELSLNQYKKLNVTFSNNLLNDKFIHKIRDIKLNLSSLQEDFSFKSNFQQIISNQNELKFKQILSEFLNDSFQNNQNDTLFVIAGRNSTVSYTEFFEKYFFSSIENTIKENKKLSFTKKTQTIDESLMLQFMEKVIRIKAIFKKYGGFSELLTSFEEVLPMSKSILREINFKITKILKGRYNHDNFGEKIYINTDNQYVHLHNTSSGQQEVIRILQDIFLIFLENSKALRIIEEPEAHLFPVAQKNLIELLALMVNTSEENQLIITTHSPYILTVFNNLLFYTRVCSRNPSAKEKIKQYFQTENLDEDTNQRINILPEDFQAYSLSTSRKIYCESIFDEEMGLISENFLDMATESMNDDFDFLSSLNVSNKKLKL